jgi:hypothetical protein
MEAALLHSAMYCTEESLILYTCPKVMALLAFTLKHITPLLVPARVLRVCPKAMGDRGHCGQHYGKC